VQRKLQQTAEHSLIILNIDECFSVCIFGVCVSVCDMFVFVVRSKVSLAEAQGREQHVTSTGLDPQQLTTQYG
jgi:hypothetical protein